MKWPVHPALPVMVMVIAGALLFASGCMTGQPPPGPPAGAGIGELTFYTEQLPPFNYEENGTLQGISVDLLEAVTEKAGHRVPRSEVRLVPWTDGYSAALSENNSVIFMTGRVPQREALFKWAGPICTNHNVLFAMPGRDILIRGPEDLGEYRIGVIADDLTGQQLLDAGVNGSRLVTETNVSVLIRKLRDGEIDLWGFSEATGRYFTEKETGNFYAFRVVYTFPEKEAWYAFNTGVPDATVQEFQQALDTVKADRDASGTTEYEKIVQRYIPSD